MSKSARKKKAKSATVEMTTAEAAVATLIGHGLDTVNVGDGDGMQDIVRLRRGDVRYWPGRGNGFWGTGKLDDATSYTTSSRER